MTVFPYQNTKGFSSLSQIHFSTFAPLGAKPAFGALDRGERFLMFENDNLKEQSVFNLVFLSYCFLLLFAPRLYPPTVPVAFVFKFKTFVFKFCFQNSWY